MMKRTINVKGIEVVQGSCVVEFNAITCIKGTMLGTKQLTHGDVYRILDTADNVTTEERAEKFDIIAKHGAVEIVITKI